MIVSSKGVQPFFSSAKLRLKLSTKLCTVNVWIPNVRILNYAEYQTEGGSVFRQKFGLLTEPNYSERPITGRPVFEHPVIGRPVH